MAKTTTKKAVSKIKTTKAPAAKPTATKAKKVTAVKTVTKARAVTKVGVKASAAKKPTAKKVVAKTPTVKAVAPKKATAKRPARKPVDQYAEIRKNALAAAQYAIERKATDVKMLDLTPITSMTDFFVIASGDSDRQVKAIAENVIASMRDLEGVSPWRSEGWDALQWIVIDFVDFVVHVFQTESRQYYNIERLWADAPTIVVEDTMPKPKAVKAAKTPKTTKSLGESVIRVIDDFREVGGAA